MIMIIPLFSNEIVQREHFSEHPIIEEKLFNVPFFQRVLVVNFFPFNLVNFIMKSTNTAL